MIIFIIAVMILAIIIGIVLICEWSFIEIKLCEAKNKKDGKSI